ncbi:hypothetical protein TNCV_37301 [Trichonephila clavipes]|nr:hypothetical protein TNCV_37301 [Trichonephila clavipes]
MVGNVHRIRQPMVTLDRDRRNRSKVMSYRRTWMRQQSVVVWFLISRGPTSATVGEKVFEKGSKRYRISMTITAHTFPVKPKQLQENPLGDERTPTVQSRFVTL